MDLANRLFIVGILVASLAGCGQSAHSIAHSEVASWVHHPGPWIPPPIAYPYPGSYWNNTYPPYGRPNSYPQYPVFISFFTASPSQTHRGEPVTLSWSTSNAAYVAVEGHGGTYPASGSIVVNPTESTVYNLRAFTADGIEGSSRLLQVNVVERPPLIASFWASLNHINRGETSNLHIYATHCQQVQLTAVGDSSVNGTYPCLTDLSVSPQQTTVYTVRVFGTNGQVIDSSPVKIIVDAPPTKPIIESFFVTKSTINTGEYSELKWNVSQASRIEVTGFVGQAPNSGSMPISPTQTTTYVLRAYSSSGGVSEAQATITVNVPSTPPRIDHFGAHPMSIEAGETANLNWAASECTHAEILEDQLYSVPCRGSMQIRPSQSKSYTLRVYNAKGEVETRLISVNVRPRVQVPTIDQFYATTMSLSAGQSTTIHWSVSHATRLEFVGIKMENPPLRGFHTFVPDKSQVIRLNAYDNNQKIATAVVSIHVNSPVRPSIGYFYGGNGSGYATVGKPFRLHWSVINCGNVEISGVKRQNLGPKASIDVILRRDKTFTLRCMGTDGTAVESSIHIKTIGSKPSSDEALDALSRAMQGIAADGLSGVR